MAGFFSDIWAEISVAGNVLVLVYSVSMDTLPDIPKMSTGPPIEGGFAPLPPFPSLFGRTCSLFSAIAVHALAIALCVLMWVTLTQHLSPDKSVWAWRTFPLHPILMVLAFGLIAPIAAAGWATYERHFDMPHWAVKAFHGTMMLTATVTGTVGVVDMWLVHEDSAQAQHDNGYSVHFQSAHSWVGIAALSLFILQATGGIAAFAMPRGEKVNDKFLAPHRWLGSAAAQQVAFIALITGILSLAGRGDGQGVDLAYKISCALALALCILLGLLLHR